jgi:DNA-binding MarR family transcriptional regulator/GNAT superfamily N-acetyltransferase
MPSDIPRIRRFNRAITLELGALDQSYLGLGRPLGTARLLCAIGAEGAGVQDLREAFGLDSGQLSRLLRALEDEGLITTAPDPDDARRRIARPTDRGLDEIARYDRLSDDRAERMQTALGPEAPTLIAAMERVAILLSRDRIRIAPTDPASPEAQACLTSYFAELDRRFPGGFSPGPPGDPDDYRAPKGLFLTARLDDLTLGCVALSYPAAEVKRLWIAPQARGTGLAPRLMQAVEDAARKAGLSRLVLDTNATLTEALALYRRLGWTEIPRYNDNPHAQAWFGRDLGA